MAQQTWHLKADEVQEILELMRAEDTRMWCITVLAMNHCMRVSELVGGAPALEPNSRHGYRPAFEPLRLDEIKPTTISVRRLKGSNDTPNQPLINHRGKPLFSDKAAIDAYMKERIDDGSDLMFTSQKGRMCRFTVEKAFAEFCKRVSANRVARGATPIPEQAMKFHALKHTGCTTIGQTTKNLWAVMNWAGHRSVSSAVRYQHSDARQIAHEVQNAFGKAFAAA